MRSTASTFLFILCCILTLKSSGQESEATLVKLDNPITEEYLKDHLPKKGPRLILNKEIRQHLLKEVETNPLVKNYYEAIKLNAREIMTKPPLERIQTGRRLLSISREMLYRMGMLGMVYVVEKDKEVLEKINQELLAVCAFSDWNPSHFLDVAEMSLAVAIGLDWTQNDLPKETVKLVKQSLKEKGIEPSYGDRMGWINRDNNWNQVCHAGMIAASLMIAEDEPALAAKTIHRALEGIPHGMQAYGPDGVYPEGSTYWAYGTSFTVLTIAMLESALGDDFGLADYPAFLESADFMVLTNTPSGMYYNFADCGDRRSENPDIILAWFARYTGNANYLEKNRFMRNPESMGELSRISGMGLVWLAQYEDAGKVIEIPSVWKGHGTNPIAIFKSAKGEKEGYYFGGKGGRGTVNHGNMDGGSFIFEVNGVRWVIDPGNQPYHQLEKTGFNLWGNCQECERWTLLTKNNFGHSTLSVNNALHQSDGLSTIIDFQEGDQPQVTFDLTPSFGMDLKKAHRTFRKENDQSLLIEDHIEKNDSTNLVTWQLMTTADVQLKKGGAVLSQDGKSLSVDILSHPDLYLSIISLDPPPHPLDRVIPGLKRIELRLPAYMMEDEEIVRVRLSGE